MPLSDFSVQVGNALLSAFPQFEDFMHAGPGQFHLEIRYPHPRAQLELLVTTENEEITVFLGSTHRHIGMCQQWPVEKQIEAAKELIGGILSGTIPLARSSKHSGLWIDEDRSHAEHPDPDETVTFTTWNEIAANKPVQPTAGAVLVGNLGQSSRRGWPCLGGLAYVTDIFMKPNSTARGLIVWFCALAICNSCVSPIRSVTTKTGLRYQIIVAGNGPVALPGQSVRIHETTRLADGTLIYSTRTKNSPLKFLLGGNQVIAGVDEGLTGMRVGERRKLIVPPSLSKRSVYPANTPPDATLYYDIELVEILPK